MSEVGTFVEHGGGAVDRFLAKGLPGTQAVWGGVVVGLMRALLECDCQPGVFRTPQDPDWRVLYCSTCHGWWERQAQP